MMHHHHLHQAHTAQQVATTGAGVPCPHPARAVLCLTSRRGGSRACRQRCEALLPASAAAAGLALAFLPWSGCSQGGFYATGVEGVHGRDCQAIYQPAAAAEQRLAARLRQQQQPATASSGQQQSGAPSLSSRQPASSSSDGVSEQPQQGAAAGQASSPSPQQLPAAEQLQRVPEVSKDLVRDIMEADNRVRTKQLVDDAWQTLE